MSRSVGVLVLLTAAGCCLARETNTDALKVSTIFTARDVLQNLSNDEAIDAAIDACRKTSISHVFIEVFRGGTWAPREMLEHARDRFSAAGFEVSGAVTTTRLARTSTGRPYLACYTSDLTQRQLQQIFEYAASMFNEIIIDDFLYTDCECSECSAARCAPKYKRVHTDCISWADYRCDLMTDVAREFILKPAKAVNPSVKIIIKYPQWYDRFEKRGYNVARESVMFDRIWVGTETRDPNSEQYGRKNQYEAYYIMRWLGEIGGDKCGGGWFDQIQTSPVTYVEQARQTVLGGAKEMLLFAYGSLRAENNSRIEALREEMPGLMQLAALVRGKTPRGIAAPKPPNSEAYDEQYIYDFVGMLGLPLVPTAHIRTDAKAAFLPVQTLRDPDIMEKIAAMLKSGSPLLITDGLMKRLVALDVENPNIQLLRVEGNPYNLHKLSRKDLMPIRDKMLAPFGVRFDAPNKVALYLFDDDLAVIENFNDEPIAASLEIAGLRKADRRLTLPAHGRVEFDRKNRRIDFSAIAPRTLVAVEYR